MNYARVCPIHKIDFQPAKRAREIYRCPVCVRLAHLKVQALKRMNIDKRNGVEPTLFQGLSA